MKNSRLFEILYILMEHRGITAGELSARLEVSVRAIYRDLDTLSAAGIPVYTERGHGGGIRLMEHFQLDRTLLGEEEQEHIMTALQSLDAVGAADSGSLLSQLAGLFGRQTVDWLEVDFETWGAGKLEKKYFELCKYAILHRRLLTFRYYNSSGIKSRRTVETCCILSRRIDTPTIEVEMKVEAEDVTEKPTYKKINEYVEKKYGFKVHSKYIAEVKAVCGLSMHEAPNKTDTPKREYPKCPPEKVEAIKDALQYFGLIE